MRNVKVNFFLKMRTNKDNHYPILMTISIGFDRTQVFTGLWIPRNRWNDKIKKVRGRDDESKIIND